MMDLEETIYKRKSTRAYQQTPLDEKTILGIEEFIEQTRKLCPDIEYTYDIVDKDNIKTLMPWRAPQYIIIYSQTKKNYKQNIGFIFQQVDLYLQSKEIGSCWVGMAKPKNKQEHKGMEYVIAMAIGNAEKQVHRKIEQFKRKQITQITDREDEKLKPIQYAPSAINSQPWYITHNQDKTYNIYRQKQGMLKRQVVERWNQIDIGIGLAHMYVANRETFHYEVHESHEQLKNHIYEGTFRI